MEVVVRAAFEFSLAELFFTDVLEFFLKVVELAVISEDIRFIGYSAVSIVEGLVVFEAVDFLVVGLDDPLEG